MFGNLGNIAEMMKMAKNAQSNLKKLREELAQSEYVCDSGDVKVTVSGELSVKSLEIKNPQLSGEELNQAIADAVNTALDQARNALQEKMASLTGGLNIPGLF